MKLITFIGSFGSITSAVMVIFRPANPRFISSLLPNPTQLSFVFKTPLAIIQLLVNGFHFYAVCFHVCTVFLYSEQTVTSLRKLRRSLQGRRVTWEHAFKSYMHLQVSQASFSVIYGQWFWGMQIWAVSSVVLNFYQAVVLSSFRSLVLATTISIAYSWLLGHAAKVHDSSHELIIVARGLLTKRKKLYARLLKSSRPLSVPLGHFFHIDRGLVLTTMAIMVNNSATLILAN